MGLRYSSNANVISTLVEVRKTRNRVKILRPLGVDNVMYFPKDVTLEMWNQRYNQRSTWEKWTNASHIVQARLDFIDHWFSMKDEQTTNIIDADIGGKIGEAKIIVNHQHHEPHNRTAGGEINQEDTISSTSGEEKTTKSLVTVDIDTSSTQQENKSFYQGVKRYQENIENIKATTSKPLPLGTENIATSLHGQKKEWIDPGYVDPVSRNTEAANLAFLDAKNYDGLKHLTVDFAKIYLEHELPVGYSIIRRIGKGAFGCCFLIEKKLETVAPNRGNLRRTESMADEDVREGTEDNRYLQLVLKVVVGGITPRRPVMFYKSCSEYTLMISHKAIPLKLDNLKFIIGILKYRHTEHGEVHGDLHPGNMMYFPKDVTLEMWHQQYNLRSTWEKCTHASHIVQARLDFIDHWFSMKDEQTTNIIDADIGGKIGEAKIIVNHQHHDPRNRTWQVSDDLIGLMNWVYKVVILQSGHSLSSHDKRGIVYQITFKSLKMLYKHITDLYDALDSKFIFTSVFATVEPFGLQLEPGCCYLDELLEGQFLEFQRFKGSYSLASSADGATSCVKMIVPTVVQAVPMSQNKVYETFRQLMSDALFLSTLGEVLKLLVDPCIQGGVIFLIVDKVYKDKLKIQALDKNALTEVCRQHAIRVFDPSFKHILSSFCAHSGTDRWEAPLLQDLENALKNESQTNEPRLVSLRGQPKDGAFVLSHKGTILAAASRLEHLAPHLALLKVDGTRVGTRHAAALGVAEWMRSERIYGAVFVKSDAGSVHVMIPDHDEEVPRIAALVDD